MEVIKPMRAVLEGFFDGLDSLTRNGAFRHYGPAFISMEVALLMVAALFWQASFIGGSAFSPETWGEWACQWPAQLWAGLTLIGSTLTATGLIHPAKRWRILAGAALQGAQFTALALSAALTGGQFVIAAYAFLVFVPFHALLIIGAFRHVPK